MPIRSIEVDFSDRTNTAEYQTEPYEPTEDARDPVEKRPKTSQLDNLILVSKKCQKGNPGRPLVPAEQRFVKGYKVIKKTGCHKWKGVFNKYGRSTFYTEGKNVDPRRYAWENYRGVKATGKLVVTCGMVECVNPEHMKQVNTRKFRQKQHAFNVEGVQEIRARYDAGESIVTIAKKWEASEQSVRQVATRKSYTWVPEE